MSMSVVGYVLGEAVVASPLVRSGRVSATATVAVVFETTEGPATGESYPALDVWPTEAFLRLSRAEGGCLAFRFTGIQDGREMGDYDNPSCGIAKTDAFIPPIPRVM